jgi:choline kinase
MRRVVGNAQPGISVTIDRKDSYDEDDMKVVEEGGRLKAIGKRLPKDRVNAESIGLLAFRSGGRGAIPRCHRAGDAHARRHDHLVPSCDPPPCAGR